MRILHTSDWHLGKRLGDFDRVDEQIEILNEICEIAEKQQVNAVLLAGDLFDTFNPPITAVELFYKYLKRLTSNGERAVVAIAGNHDSPDRIEAPHPLARECGIIFAGYPNSELMPFELESGLKVLNSAPGFLELKLPRQDLPLRLLLTPYANELRLKTYLGHKDTEKKLRELLHQNWQETADQYCDTNGVNMLVSHLFFANEGDELPEEPEDEKSILSIGGAQAVYTSNIPAQIQYSALGHLHRMQKVSSNTFPVYYSGSPLSYSFAEANQDKYVIIAELEPAKIPEINKIKLLKGKKLYRKKFDSIGAATSWLEENPNCFVELTIQTNTYITAEDQKQLKDSHNGIVSIIPELLEDGQNIADNKKSIDLSMSIEEQFAAYFFHKNGQEPNKELLDLFREVVSNRNNN